MINQLQATISPHIIRDILMWRFVTNENELATNANTLITSSIAIGVGSILFYILVRNLAKKIENGPNYSLDGNSIFCWVLFIMGGIILTSFLIATTIVSII